MPNYRYMGTDAEGRPVEGERGATSRFEAVAALLAQGWHVDHVESTDAAAETAGDPGRPASDVEIAATERIADLVRSGLPLGPGLAALATEVPSRRLRRSLQAVSADIDRGVALDEALNQHPAAFPQHLLALIHAGLRSGRLVDLLDHYLHFTRSAQDMRRRIWLAVAYPLILLCSASAICLFMTGWIVPQFGDLFESFDAEVPWLTLEVLRVSHLIHQWWYLVIPALLLVPIAAWFGIGLTAGPGRRRACVYRLPVLGRMLRLAALSRFCHLMAIGVEHQVPLAETVRMAGDGSRDPLLRETSVALARDIDAGRSLAEAGYGRRELQGVNHLFEWESRQNAFPAALRASADIFAAQAGVQTGLVRLIFEPLTVLIVATVIGLTVVALFLPMFNLLRSLS